MLGMCGIRQSSCLSLAASLMGKCSLVLPWAIVVRYSPVHRSPASPVATARIHSLMTDTRRHFPVREDTKDKKLDSQIPQIPSISITYTQYARYVQTQHGITTWLYNSSIYSIGSEERDNTNMGLMTQQSEHTSQSTSGSLTCLSTDIYKWKRLRSLTIYQILPRAQDRSWGIKLNVEVRTKLLARPRLSAKHKIGKREYKCTQQDLHQNYLHMHHYQQRGGGV